MSWTDFRSTAPWRDVQWKADEWRAWPERSKSTLFQMQNFTPWLLAMDYMHCKYLGHDMLVYGSILSLLVNHVMPDADPTRNLASIWASIQQFYKEHHVACRYKYLNKLSMFERKPPAYPKLRGKAAEIKYLAGPMLNLWQAWHKPQFAVHRDILLYLKLNLQLEDLLAVHRDASALPALDAQLFEEAMTSMLLVLTRVADHFIAEKLFNITQKAHFMQHISMLSKFINPRLLWCFMGEDMQKRMSSLAKTCVKGQRPGQTIHKMFARYRLGLHLRFQQIEKE